ncbi:glycoside hydrolase family 16 protein [Gillisia sp. M10.2A]|uniref:Glycoside hydrolase family 16 protein n=1 Tax=Gillisia lutea TaxID=2909668 RepID=A0ABS9EIS6_9FLAO|nr:glycoside hydrolase family 16 protein [Gillisia lutea]MCF4102758.1 glycoside hydrolase family 16 protein [Gillisia lutea]
MTLHLKSIYTLIAALIMLIPYYTKAQNYQLEWSDEFTSPEINEKYWNFEYGLGKNNELQHYRSAKQNARIENEKLIIEAHKQHYEDANYTSARLNTLDKKHFKYGKIEVRAKLPQGKGTWPAIWMLGANHKKVGYPYCGEIDIMEFVGKVPGEVHGAIHYPIDRENNIDSVSDNYILPSTEDEFHVYSIEWNKHEINYFVDGDHYFAFNIDDAKRFGRKNVFRKPFYLVINLALGGKWAGEVDDSIFPTQFYIDYIRYYKIAK